MAGHMQSPWAILGDAEFKLQGGRRPDEGAFRATVKTYVGPYEVAAHAARETLAA